MLVSFAHRTVAGGTSKTGSHYRATGRSSGIVVETDSRSAARRVRRAPSGHARGCAYSCGGAAKADPKRIHRCRLVPPQTFTAAGRRCAGWRRRGRKASAGTTIIRKSSEEARKARFQGTVVLDTIVLEDGTVQILKIARRIGFGLEERAIAAVLQWRFRPARRNGKPVPVALNIEVNFNLR